MGRWLRRPSGWRIAREGVWRRFSDSVAALALEGDELRQERRAATAQARTSAVVVVGIPVMVIVYRILSGDLARSLSAQRPFGFSDHCRGDASGSGSGGDAGVDQKGYSVNRARVPFGTTKTGSGGLLALLAAAAVPFRWWWLAISAGMAWWALCRFRSRPKSAGAEEVISFGRLLVVPLTAGVSLANALVMASGESHPQLRAEVSRTLRRSRQEGLARALAESVGHLGELFGEDGRRPLFGGFSGERGTHPCGEPSFPDPDGVFVAHPFSAGDSGGPAHAADRPRFPAGSGGTAGGFPFGRDAGRAGRHMNPPSPAPGRTPGNETTKGGRKCLALWTRIMVWFDRDERGQGTVEYILVVLAVVAVATVLVQWVRKGSGDNLLESIFRKALEFVKGKIGFGF